MVRGRKDGTGPQVLAERALELTREKKMIPSLLEPLVAFEAVPKEREHGSGVRIPRKKKLPMVAVALHLLQSRFGAREAQIDPLAIDRERDEEVAFGGATLVQVVLRLLELLLRLAHLLFPDPSPLLPQVPDILRRELAPGSRFRADRHHLVRRPGGGLLVRYPRDRKRVAAGPLQVLLGGERRGGPS